MGVGISILFWIILGFIVWVIYSIGESYFARCAARELEARNNQDNDDNNAQPNSRKVL